MIRLALAALLATTLALSASAAYAQDVSAARDAETAARRAFEAGDYEAAARSFAEADRLAPRAATRYNEALSWARARKDARAADAYAAALAMGSLDGKREEASRERLQRLRAGLSILAVAGPAGGFVTVAHAAAVPLPAEVHLDPGRYEVLVKSPDGREVRRWIVTEAAQRLVLDPTPSPSGSRAAPPSSGAPKATARPPVEPGEPGALQRTGGFVAIGVGGAVGVVAAVFGARTLGAIDDFDRNNTNAQLRDRALSLRAATNVLVGASVVLGGSGVALLLTAPRARSGGAAASLRLAPTGASLAIQH